MTKMSPPKKTGAFAVTIRRGRGPYTWRVAGQSARAVEMEIEGRLAGGDVIGSVVYLGFKPVYAEPDDDSNGDVKFLVGDGDDAFVVKRSDPGFHHLLSPDTEGVSGVDSFYARLNAD